MAYNHLYLAHHGIKGMKWGKRNGPPYPLGESDKSAAEKRAEHGYSVRRKQDSKSSKPKEQFWTDENKARAKKIAIGVAVVAAVGVVSYEAYKHGAFDGLTKSGKDALGNSGLLGIDGIESNMPTTSSPHGGSIADLPSIDGSAASREIADACGIQIKNQMRSVQDDLIDCNPSWHDGSPHTGNCPASVVAFAMRRGGYEANALPNPNPFDPETGLQKEMFSLDEADRYFRTAIANEDARTTWRSSESLTEANERAFAKMERTIVGKYAEGSVVMIEASHIPNPDVSHEHTFRHAIAGVVHEGRLVLANAQEGENRIHIESMLFGEKPAYSLCGTGSSGHGGRYCLLDPNEVIPETIGEILETNRG